MFKSSFPSGTLAVLLLVLAVRRPASGADEFVVAERGKPAECSIVVEAEGPSSDYAAEELRSYLWRQTGVELQIVKGAEASGRRIVFAAGDAALGDDGFAIAATVDELRISGGKRGLLFGAYETLTRFGGVEWFSSWCEVVPQVDRFVVPAGYRDVQKPAIAVREVFWADVTAHAEFAARLRLNNRSWQKDDPRTGGNAWRFGGGLGNCHTFNALVPPETYFKNHPEYFSEIGGTRVGKRSQLCLTNPDVLAIATSNVLAAIRRDPTAACYGVSQNDWHNFCTCAKCKAIDDAEGSQAGTLLGFVNAIADAVKAAAPDKTVETLAYQYTRTPPKTVRPRDNVMVCLCSIECDFSKAMTRSRNRQNVKFRDDIRQWGAMTRKLYVWDYTTDYENYLMPFPNVMSLGDNIRFFRDNGTFFLFEQGVHRSYHGDLAELKTWLMAKLMWNPDQPVEPLIDRFCRGYYGKAAPFAREYVRRLHAFDHDETKSPLTCYTAIGGHASSSDAAFLDWAHENWLKAESAVLDDPLRRYNVRTSAMPVDYVLFKLRYKRVNLANRTDGETWRTYASRLRKTLKAAEKVGRPVTLCESKAKSDKRLKAMDDALDGKVEICGDGKSAWQEESALPGGGPAGACTVVDDPDASAGRARFLSNDNYQWYTTYSLDDVAFEPGVEYVLSVRFRAKPTGAPGEVVKIGVHDYAKGKSVRERSFRAADIKDGYAEYDILTWKPGPGQVLFIAPGWFDTNVKGRSDAHEGVWIDGFRLRRTD